MLHSDMKASPKLIFGIMVHEFETLMFVDVAVTARRSSPNRAPHALLQRRLNLRES